MAKPARGLPSDFALDLPDEGPVVIGDFLDEPPPLMPTKRREPDAPSARAFRPEIVQQQAQDIQTGQERETIQPRVAKRIQPRVIRYQLNLTPRAKQMLEEVVEYVRTYSPENDARTSEVFQGVIGLLHGAMNELDLSALPRRGAWGSVTARNFPGALSEAFEQAVLRSAKRRGNDI